jgi:hypothetical protein
VISLSISVGSSITRSSLRKVAQSLESGAEDHRLDRRAGTGSRGSMIMGVSAWIGPGKRYRPTSHGQPQQMISSNLPAPPRTVPIANDGSKPATGLGDIGFAARHTQARKFVFSFRSTLTQVQQRSNEWISDLAIEYHAPYLVVWGVCSLVLKKRFCFMPSDIAYRPSRSLQPTSGASRNTSWIMRPT